MALGRGGYYYFGKYIGYSWPLIHNARNSKGKCYVVSIKCYKHYVDTACNSKHPLYTGTNRSYTILSGCALEQHLNIPFCRMFNSSESIWSDPGGSKFTCIMRTQDNLDIMVTGCQGQRTNCSAIITNLTLNTVKLPTPSLPPTDNDICPETIWIIRFKMKFVKGTIVHKLLYKRSCDLKVPKLSKIKPFHCEITDQMCIKMFICM